jgi:putative endonuclease
MQHKLGEQDGFTKRYNINRLVYFETFATSITALRVKQIKSWSRAKKVSLIGSLNPTWEDMAANCSTEVKPLLPEADSSLRSE